jgi:membrane associated rhomboid family serine protease
MQQQNVFQYLKDSVRNSGMIGKIILVNTIVFLFMLLVMLIQTLFGHEDLVKQVLVYLVAPGNPADLKYAPWTVITYMFTHYAFLHFIFNMLILYFSSKIFVQFFGEKRLLSTYILGGILAYIVHVGAYYVFPVFANQSADSIVGASGAVMAVFIAVAFYRPSLKVMLFGVIPIPLIAAGIALYHL